MTWARVWYDEDASSEKFEDLRSVVSNEDDDGLLALDAGEKLVCIPLRRVTRIEVHREVPEPRDP